MKALPCRASFRACVAAACLLTPLLTGCQPSGGEKPPPVSSPVTFTDVAASAGLKFRYGYGGRSPLDLMEVSGGGGGFLDADGDGWLDILLVGQRRCALYRNNRDGTFADVTRRAGLTEQGWWMGCAAADWDRDGDVDMFLSGYRIARLYRNQGDGRFVDVSAAAGVTPGGWTAGAAFADVDRDGWLDLYVGRYARFDERSVRFCTVEGVKTSCGPEMYDVERGHFYHNQGGRRFREATAQFGLADAHGKTWGVSFADMDGNAWPDLYLANDEVPCDLFRNQRGRFRNIGLESGTAFSRDGVRQGGMGVDWGDYDNDGRPDLVVTTFFEQPKSLYRNEGGGQFAEESDVAGVALPTLPYVAWGTRFFDMDNDGWRDLIIANGHVNDNAEKIDPANHFAQPLQLFHNLPTGEANQEARKPGEESQNDEAPGVTPRSFQDVAAQAGPAFQQPIVGRGVAVGDYDNDGDVDLLIVDAARAPLLLRNDTGNRQHWLSVRVLGPNGRSDSVGARVTITAGGQRQVAEVNPGGSYFATHDPRVHFGLGAAAKVDSLEVRWPSGRVERRRDVPVDRLLIMRAGPSGSRT
jgi:enediyne biosynthesis protein E4